MGSRGKKRVRANGEVASGKQPPRRQPSIFVPPVEVERIRHGLSVFQAARGVAGDPPLDSPAWSDAYSRAQAQLREEYGKMPGDAVLWRVAFLDALLGWDHFKQLHAADGDLPTDRMLAVAASYPTMGSDTCFELDEFEEMLDELDE